MLGVLPALPTDSPQQQPSSEMEIRLAQGVMPPPRASLFPMTSPPWGKRVVPSPNSNLRPVQSNQWLGRDLVWNRIIAQPLPLLQFYFLPSSSFQSADPMSTIDMCSTQSVLDFGANIFVTPLKSDFQSQPFSLWKCLSKAFECHVLFFGDWLCLLSLL